MSTELRDELDELMNYVREQSEVLRALDAELAPYWNAQGALKDRLIRTYPWGECCGRICVVQYARHPDRADLFAEMDRLAETSAPSRILRRTIKAEIDASMRAADRIRDVLAKPPKAPKPARKGQKPTSDLFRKVPV